MAPESSASGKLIVVIDDDPAILELYSLVIQKDGFRVETAADGDEGLRKIKRLKPDLVVLDLMMPRYDGFHVLKDLQKGELSSIPVVIVTGRYTGADADRMLRKESRVVEVLLKPVKTPILTAVLRR
ncbi:MAG TPA: response regulator, partial [Elusimicrobiota bacterium]|nr:response regulator [Elusimicrobiota bacterium]